MGAQRGRRRKKVIPNNGKGQERALHTHKKISKQNKKVGKHKTTGDKKHTLLKKLTQWEKMDTAVIISKNCKQPA